MTATGHPLTGDAYELSSTQEGMLYHGLEGGTTGVDLEQIVIGFSGEFDEHACRTAFDGVVSRHAILRSRFRYDAAGRPYQEAVDDATLPVQHVDLTAAAPGERRSRLDAVLAADRARGIDLESVPAQRLTIVRFASDEVHVVWTFHHILLDGRSFPIVLEELFSIYRAAVTGTAPALSERRPYKDYIEFLRGLDLPAAEAYWRGRLAGFKAPTPLVIDHAAAPSGDDAGPIGGAAERSLPAETTAALRALAESRGVRLNTLLQAAWAILLHRYSGEEDIVFGATRACRRSAFADADEMVGLFINTLPLRVAVDSDGRLDELLTTLREQQIAVRSHEHTPLVQVQRWSEVPRGRAVFDSILVYEERSLGALMRDVEVPAASVSVSYRGQTNYPLALIAYGDDELMLRIENDRRHVDDEPAAAMLDQLARLLTAFPAHGDAPIHALPLVGAGEGVGVVGGGVWFGGAGCLHERFEGCVGVGGGRVAVVCDGVSLSYGELDRLANGLALRLRELGVGRGVVVGLRVERGLGVVVGVLGILKAGGAYLPLDPAYPRDRVEFMLGDAGVGVVVADEGFVGDFGDGVELVLVDGCGEAERGPVSGVTPDDLAYVIYTSGSTGRPKGVLISHHNVTRLFDATEAWYGFGGDDVWTLFHSYAFDFSVWELWGALLYGGRLVVVPYWVSRSPDEFRSLVFDEGVTVLNQTPSAFGQFVDADLRAGSPDGYALRYVIFGGEALELGSLRPWFEAHGDRRPLLVNMYGITETTVHVTYRPLRLADLDAGRGSVIGEPIPDLSLLLLDAHGQPVPAGVPGELYVGGAGVSRGYLGRPELTAQRFVSDPSGLTGGRLYRTGDLARRLHDGELEYLGRIDDQVKIRGFRIELGEIEAVLGSHASVSAAVVVLAEPAAGDKRLVAYIAARGHEQDQDAVVEQLKRVLGQQLPGYMVPAHFVVLDRLPLTANGKVDRKALPAPDYGRAHTTRPYVAPATPTEQQIADIWAQILGLPQISTQDDFFELGGDSILTIQVIARCRQEGMSFTPLDLAKHPTIAELAAVVRTAAPADAGEGPASGSFAPVPIQRWFLELGLADADHWNQAFVFELPAHTDGGALESALEYAFRHHDALRLRADLPELRYEADAEPPTLRRVDLGAVPVAEHAGVVEAAGSEAHRSLSIERGPLLAAVLFDRGEAPARLLIVIHHIAVDGVSWRILIEDIGAAYRSLQDGETPRLPRRTASFGAWSAALERYAATHAEASLTAWREIEAADATLPPAAGRPEDDTEANARSIDVALSREETSALLQQVPAAHDVHINDVLLTALALALARWTGRAVHRVEMEGHGREEWIGPIDVTRTVGWFTSLYPVALDVGDADDDQAALRAVSRGLRRVPDRGLSYGVLRYGRRQSELRTAPPAELLFNYLGQFDQVTSGSEIFRFADERGGPWHGGLNRRSHRLEVLALVRDGRFTASWTFGAERDSSAVVERLAGDFIAALRRFAAGSPRAAEERAPASAPALPDADELEALKERYGGIDSVQPLTPMQRLFLSLESDRATIGFEQWLFRLRGELDGDALRAAWDATAARHAILRTGFLANRSPEPLQVVTRRASMPWVELDWSDAEPAAREADLSRLLAEDRERGFDVADAPLSRVTLIQLAPDEHMLVWSTHHLCIDGWSWPLVLGDVGRFYAERTSGGAAPTGEPAQFGDYVDWLQRNDAVSESYWRRALAGVAAPTPLPAAAAPGPGAANAAGELVERLDGGRSDALRLLARSSKVTLNTVVQGAWALLLGHASAREDVVFGAAFSGRPPDLDGIETLVGPCVNNLPVRVRLAADRELTSWLRELHEQNLEIAEHQGAALADIQKWAGIPLRRRLFESLVVFQNYVIDESVLHWPGVELEPLVTPDATNYPLTLSVVPRAELELKLSGRRDQFDDASLRALLDGLVMVLGDMAAGAGRPVGGLAASLPASLRGSADPPPTTQRTGARYAAPSSEMERIVAAIWTELFEVDDVGLDDNFFDLGGHSVLLVEAHARLVRRLDREISVVTLLRYPTVRSLAAFLVGADGDGGGVADAQRRAQLQRRAMAGRRRPPGRP